MDNLLTGLRAAAEPTRLRILALLSHGELTVSELTRILGQSQPRVSRHLKLLCDAGLARRIPEGTWAFYRLAEDGPNRHLVDALAELLPREDEATSPDRARLAEVKQERARQAADYFRQNADKWDNIRSLHVSEQAVEAMMCDMIGDAPVAHILDLGTGTGQILRLMADRAEKATGIDFSREMLALARANLDAAGCHNAQVRLAEIQSLPLPDDCADLITIHQVLHYLDDPAIALREAARVLKPGGRILLVDFAPHEIEKLREEHAHRRLGFSESEVLRWCDNAGLKVDEMRHLPPASADGLTVCLWLATPASTQAHRHRDELQEASA